MNKDILLMESSEIYLFAEVEYTLEHDPSDNKAEVERFFYRVGDYEAGLDYPVKTESFPKEAISKFDDIISSEFPSEQEFKDNQF